MKKQKAFKFCIYPNNEQITLIHKTFGCARFVFNKMLADDIAEYEKTQKRAHKTPASYKIEYEFLKEVDSLALCNAQLNLDKAFTSMNLIIERVKHIRYMCLVIRYYTMKFSNAQIQG